MDWCGLGSGRNVYFLTSGYFSKQVPGPRPWRIITSPDLFPNVPGSPPIARHFCSFLKSHRKNQGLGSWPKLDSALLNFETLNVFYTFKIWPCPFPSVGVNAGVLLTWAEFGGHIGHHSHVWQGNRGPGCSPDSLKVIYNMHLRLYVDMSSGSSYVCCFPGAV